MASMFLQISKSFSNFSRITTTTKIMISTDEIYQADGHGHLPDVKKRDTDTLSDRVIGLSVRSVSAFIKHLIDL
jgi:hypothetical protein